MQWFKIPDLNNGYIAFDNGYVRIDKEIEAQISQIERWAFELEVCKNFRSFSAMDFLKKYDEGSLNENDFRRFFYMYYVNKIIVRENKKQLDEANKNK